MHKKLLCVFGVSLCCALYCGLRCRLHCVCCSICCALPFFTAASLPKMTYKKQNLFFIGVSLHAISRFWAVFLHFYRFSTASAYKKKPRRACACRGLRFSAAAISEGLHLIEWPIHDPALPVSLWLIAVQSRPDMRTLKFLLVQL